ncbi:outer membrane protein [Zavarzinia sp. CC-PAN008]|uniref:outer membrane protein n=1 Tax=Zavarzinia sp. CC-PAN008 TaxID=3243332 RepID=UPI003F745A14
MRRHLLSGVTLAAMMVAGGAHAQDAGNWAGAYGGLNIGYGTTADGDVVTTGQVPVNVNNVAGGARPGLVEVDNDGIVAGGQIGYNWQFGVLVLGAEADISFADISDDITVTTRNLAGTANLNNDFESSLDYLATFRGRVGYSLGQSLVYVTGGLALGDVENRADFFGAAGQLQFTGEESGTEVGYTVGAGFEAQVAPQWSLKGEYLYYDLGSETVNVAVIPGSGGGGTGYDSEFENAGHIFRIGVNYHFNTF